MQHLLDVFADSLAHHQRELGGNGYGLTAENAFISSTPGGMICLASAIGSSSSVSTIHGKCWLIFTPSRSSERLALKLAARIGSLSRSLSCPKLYCETTLVFVSKIEEISGARPTYSLAKAK